MQETESRDRRTHDSRAKARGVYVELDNLHPRLSLHSYAIAG